MDNNHKIKKEYLIRMLNSIQGEDIGLEEYEAVRWFELRGYSYEEARQEVFNKYRKVLLRDDNIAETIVRFKDIYGVFESVEDSEREITETIDDEQKYRNEYIHYLAGSFCNYGFTIENNTLIDESGIIDEIREVYIANIIVQGYIQQKEYQESQLRQYENIVDKPETKAEKLGQNITPYGFLDLPKTRDLSDESKIKLIELVANNSLPYAVAMLDFLGFIKHLKTHYFEVEDKLFKKISKYLGSDLDGRSVKGNYYTLNENYREDKKRYTAYKHKEKVAKDYEALR